MFLSIGNTVNPRSGVPRTRINIMTKSVFETVTANIIESLENGVKPWECPWNNGISQKLTIPFNFSTHNHYKGINVLCFWSHAINSGFNSSGWMTFNQIKNLGLKLKKGSKAAAGIYFGKSEKENEEGKKEEYFFAKQFSVFNCDQVEGLKEEFQNVGNNKNINELLGKLNVAISHVGNKAYYDRSTDVVTMPAKERFSNEADYYATLIHEVAHWTGAETRLNRTKGARFGDADYAFEEMVAELTAAFVMAELGLAGHNAQHENYIGSWLKALQSNSKYVYEAAKLAEKAANFILEA